MTTSASNTVEYGEDVQFVSVEHLNQVSSKVVVIKAGMGYGKTTSVIDYINGLPKEARVLVLTARKSFAKTTTMEFNRLCTGEVKFESYLGMTPAEVRKCKRLFIQFESLGKLLDENNLVQGFELVVIDEGESILTQAVSKQTNGDRIDDNHRVFLSILDQCQKVFLMDAFISERTLRMLKRLGMDYTYLIYHRKPVEREAICFNEKSQNATKQEQKLYETRFVNQLIRDLADGKKIYMFVSSLRKLAQIVDSVLTAQSETKVLRYSSEDKSPLDNIRKEWVKYDLVITTSTITVGCNFDVPDCFDRCYMYLSSCSRNLVRDAFQAHMRVRHLNEDCLVYLLDPTQYPFSKGDSNPDWVPEYADREQVVDRLQRKYREAKQLFGHRWQDENPLWFELYVDYLTEANHSYFRLVEQFNLYLKACNYQVRPASEEELEWDMTLVEADELPDFSYETPRRLTAKELEELKLRRMTEPLADIEKASIEKYYFDSSVKEDELNVATETREELWKLYKKVGRRRFLQARVELGLRRGLISFDDVLNQGKASMWGEGMETRMQLVSEVCRRLGLDNTLERQQVPRDKMFQLVASEEFESLLRKCCEEFAIRDRATKKNLEWALHILTATFEGWSGAKLDNNTKQRKQKMVNGKKVDCHPLVLTPPQESFTKYVHPRARQDKERDRLQQWQQGRS